MLFSHHPSNQAPLVHDRARCASRPEKVATANPAHRITLNTWPDRHCPREEHSTALDKFHRGCEAFRPTPQSSRPWARRYDLLCMPHLAQDFRYRPSEPSSSRYLETTWTPRAYRPGLQIYKMGGRQSLLASIQAAYSSPAR